MLNYLAERHNIPTGSVDPEREQVVAYLLAWQSREGSFLSAPSARRLPPDYAERLNSLLSELLDTIDVPTEIISRHPGVSAFSLQSLLEYFRGRRRPVEQLVPSTPESDDAWPQFIAVFNRINSHLYPAFNRGIIPVYALVTLEWMRGLPLPQIIRNRISYLERNGRNYRVAAVIRETMKDVEEIARFRAPKYLSAYMDVLGVHLDAIGRSALISPDLKFDLYLEFGVSSKTLLSLIGLGLSRTSAIAINEFIAADDLDEQQVLDRLASRRWETLSIPVVVKREIDRVVQRRLQLIS